MAFAAIAIPLMSFRSSAAPPKQRQGHFHHFSQVVRQDSEFIKKRFHGFKTQHLPKLSKSISDLFWLRNLEDPKADQGPPIQPPTPSYSGLSGMDLLMADIKALKEYAIYVYYVSRIWSKPLPEVYEPEKVTGYFSCRPHVVAFRLLEVFSTFAFVTIKMRTFENLKKFNGFRMRRDDTKRSSDYYIGQLLKETMLKLGPTFIKVGQSISTRPDIIGSEISKALSELHEKIPPFPRATAMKIIEEELGCPAYMVFTCISDEPVAAASFGQVYRGCTSDGYSVAIKVQRPNLHHAVALDVYILRIGLELVQKVAKRKNDLRLYADELGRGLLGELDYSLEAANAGEFLEAHARFPFMYVPRVLSHLSRKKVLTMEWLFGENPNELLLLSQVSDGAGHPESRQLEAKKHLLDLVNKGVEATLVQLLETGLLHGDPHPGNLRYTPAGQIGFLDFGLLCRMKKKHQFAMLASIVHIVNGDWRALVYDLTEMDVVRPGTNIPLVTMELEDSLGEITFKDGIPDVKFSKVLSKIWSLAIKYHFRMPPYYTLLLRSLASLEGLAVAADQDFKTFQAAYPYVVRKLLTDNSPATMRILHSVVFNKSKEFKWQKLAMFLRVGAKRISVHELFRSDSGSHSGHVTSEANSIFQVANLIMRLLSSKDGAVLRRLLMTVDPKSLVQAMVCKEAAVFRQQLSRALADVLHQWLMKTFGWDHQLARSYGSHVKVVNAHNPREMALSSESPVFFYQALGDRRAKLIIYRILNAVGRDPMLTLRFCWSSVAIFVTAAALACHRLLVSWSEIFIPNSSFVPWRVAVKV